MKLQTHRLQLSDINGGRELYTNHNYNGLKTIYRPRIEIPETSNQAHSVREVETEKESQASEDSTIPLLGVLTCSIRITH